MIKSIERKTALKLSLCILSGSVIQANGRVEYGEGLWIGNYLKAGNGLQRVRNFLGFDQGQCVHPDSSEGRLNSNLLVSAWPLGVKPGDNFNYLQPQWWDWPGQGKYECVFCSAKWGKINNGIPTFLPSGRGPFKQNKTVQNSLTWLKIKSDNNR